MATLCHQSAIWMTYSRTWNSTQLPPSSHTTSKLRQPVFATKKRLSTDWIPKSQLPALSVSPFVHSLQSGQNSYMACVLEDGDPVVSREWLSNHLDDVCILDVRGQVITSLVAEGMEFSKYEDSYSEYLEGHIPGAVFFNWLKDGIDLSAPVPVQLMDDSDKFASVVEEKGVTIDKPVVVYDGGDGLLAPRLWWALVRHGHPCVYVLNGGYKKWMAEGGEIELSEPCPLKVYASYEPLKIHASVSVSCDNLLSLIHQKKGSRHCSSLEEETLSIVDARNAEQYKGIIRRSKHGGRIPGAINIPRRLFLEPSGMFKSIDEQRKVFINAGLKPNEPTKLVAYCNGGVASCTILLAWHRIGGRGSWANYDGSWNEWGNRDDLPHEL